MSDTQADLGATVAEDEAVRAVHAALVELSDKETRLRARQALLAPVLARRFNNRIAVAPEVAGLAVIDAARELAQIDHELAELARRFDAQHGALEIADAAAQARIVEAATPAYQQLVNESARQVYLADLRRRGVFQIPAADTTSIPDQEPEERRDSQGERARNHHPLHGKVALHGSAYCCSLPPARRPRTGQIEYSPPEEGGRACYPARSRNPRVATPT